MDIISKREGPRTEDVKAKRMISQNMPVIRQLADQISNGGYTKMRQQQAARAQTPEAEGKLIVDMKTRLQSDEADPYIKISVNNRVVLACRSTGRQIQLIGEIRGNVLSKKLVLATSENGFLSPINDEIYAAIGDLNGVEITRDFTEAHLARVLGQRLELDQND